MPFPEMRSGSSPEEIMNTGMKTEISTVMMKVSAMSGILNTGMNTRISKSALILQLQFCDSRISLMDGTT